VELEISPEPSPEEREAIAAALAELEEQGAPSRGPWWTAGLPAEEEDED
jgi:hypothetical protein